MPFTPYTGDDIWDPKKWKDEGPTQAFDTGRHYGAVGLASLMSPFKSQLADVQGGIDMQRQSRSQLNQLMSPIGRQAQVRSYGQSARRRGQQMGRKLASQLQNQGMGDQRASADLWAANRAADETGQYAMDLESPEGLAQIARMIDEMNDPEEVLSLLRALGMLEDQDMPRTQLHEQLSAADAAGNGLGGLIGTGLSLLTAGGGGGGMSALMKLFGGGGGKESDEYLGHGIGKY